MKSRALSLAIMLCMLLMILVPAVSAQIDTSSINFDEILARLAPRTGNDLLFDLLLYGIFGLGFITMLLVPDKQLLPSMLMVLVLGMALLAKVELFAPTDFAIFVINVGMWVIPWVVAGMVRERNRRPRAMVPGIIVGFLGAGYFFLFWALRQSGA